MEYPSWIPEWVKAEFPEVGRTDDGDIDSEERQESREQMVRVIESPLTQVVWESLGKFNDRNDRLYKLGIAIWGGHWGFGHVATKKSERKRILANVRKSADFISDNIQRLTQQDAYALNSIVHQVFANDYVKENIGFETEWFHSIWNDQESPNFVPVATLQASAPAIQQIGQNIAATLAFTDLPLLLRGLCDALSQWADRPLPITKPDHDHARRLYFLRSVTDDFVREYGRPFRKETLALASVFFDCSGLDEASVSRIAPVRTSG